MATLRRLGLQVTRYGFRPAKLEKRIAEFIQIATRVTLPITASLLEKHPSLLQEGAEYAVHGFLHLNYSTMAPRRQRLHLQKALQILKRLRLPEVGFRAPYLKTNKETLRLLSQMGFLYDSSSTIHWNILPAARINKQYHLALQYYRPKDSRETQALPFWEEGILRIPVSLPDDEMLIDRLRIRDQEELFKIWSEILLQCQERNEIFVLLLHPERFHLADRALARLVDLAEKTGMWIATLKEAAQLWKSRAGTKRWPQDKGGAFCITGDIDKLTLRDVLIRPIF
jgi:peptidoglycan/xylan/chitin deacetylase (PgdA/CDA1 family)